MTRPTTLNSGKPHYQHVEEKELMQQFNYISQSGRNNDISPRQLPGSGNRLNQEQSMIVANAANSAGRRQRVKSGRKRRFSSSSINKNGEHGTSSNQRHKNPLQVQGTKEGICTEVMSHAAAQIMNYNGSSADPMHQ